MSWRLGIRHRTGFQYRQEVVSSYNEARIMPLSTPDQLVIDAEVSVSPGANVFRYWDYWGTLVYAFDIHHGHKELSVTGTSVVETSRPPPPPDGFGWDDLAASGARERFAELLEPTDYVPVDDEVSDAARALASNLTPVAACEAVIDWVRSHLRYETGTTTVSTTALDALTQGGGVCQDFAHLTLALLRAVGIPARYVSGYLHPSADPEVGVSLEGQSHAWVEAWLGEWAPFDPTHGRPADERNVVIGRARDYADVSPLKGIFHGGPAEALVVSVELSRLA